MLKLSKTNVGPDKKADAFVWSSGREQVKQEKNSGDHRVPLEMQKIPDVLVF